MSDTLLETESTEVAEQSVLGSMLLAGEVGTDTIDEVTAILDVGDFIDSRRRAIYRAILGLHGEGEPVDIVIVGDRLGDRLEECGGHAYLLQLSEVVPHVGYAPHYAKIVRDKAGRRRGLAATKQLTAILTDPNSTPEQVQAACEAVVNAGMGVSRGGHPPIKLADILAEHDPRHLPPRRVFPIGEGFEDVDLAPEKIVLLGAPPGGGKTALVMQLATEATINDGNIKVLIANIEMPIRDLIHRQLARLSGVPLRAVLNRGPNLARVWNDRIEHGINLIEEVGEQLFFAREPRCIESIAAEAHDIKPDIIILDYIQKIGPRGGRDNVRDAISDVMTHARRLADAGACVIVVSAIGRDKEGHKKGLSSFRESSDLEYSADDAWVLEPGKEVAGIREITMRRVKARNGALCDLPLLFDGLHQSIRLATPDPATEGA